jgi:hypothetical protein
MTLAPKAVVSKRACTCNDAHRDRDRDRKREMEMENNTYRR